MLTLPLLKVISARTDAKQLALAAYLERRIPQDSQQQKAVSETCARCSPGVHHRQGGVEALSPAPRKGRDLGLGIGLYKILFNVERRGFIAQ